jgi:hypothetical protein
VEEFPRAEAVLWRDSTAMNKTQILETHAGNSTRAVQSAEVPSRYKTCPAPADNRTLYVLAFGLLGAILANMLALLYDASLFSFG